MDASSSSLRRSTKQFSNRAPRNRNRQVAFPPDETTCNRFRFLVESENCSHAQKALPVPRNRIAHPCRQLRRPAWRRRRRPHAHPAAARPHLLCPDRGYPAGRPAVLHPLRPGRAHSPLSLVAASVRHGHSALPPPAHPVLFPLRSHRRYCHHFLHCLGRHSAASSPALSKAVPPAAACRRNSIRLPHHFCPLQYCPVALGRHLEARAEPDHGRMESQRPFPTPAASRSSSAGLDHLRRALLRPDLRAPRWGPQPPQLRRSPRPEHPLHRRPAGRLSHRKSRPFPAYRQNRRRNPLHLPQPPVGPPRIRVRMAAA